MTAEEIRATLTICLLASFADGEKHDREREQIRQVAESLAGDQQINLPSLYQDVLLRRVQLADVVARLASTEARQLAYEMAVCVCEADGQTSAKEQAFLASLRQAWGMGGGNAAPAVTHANTSTAAAVATSTAAAAPLHFELEAQTVADAPLQAP